MLLKSSSTEFAADAVSRLDEYSMFWSSFSHLCRQCASKLATSSLFAFLS